jgi:hypothetical protein
MGVSFISKLSFISALTVCTYFLPLLNPPVSAFPVHRLSRSDGKTGEDKTVFAKGSAISIDISGRNGKHGGNGSSGSDASCETPENETFENQTWKNENKDSTPKSGGDGSNGGDGGNGGNGGFLTVYYQKLDDIKQIYVHSQGGKGGRGGRGGEGGIGGSGCNGGSSGSSGSNGRDGQPGLLGKLFIINRSEPLAEIKPKEEIKIGDLLKQPVFISTNIWKTRQGATQLLASGSIIDDVYQEFDRRVERNVRLVLQVPSDLDSVKNEKATVFFSDLGEVKVSFPDKVLVKGNLVQEKDITKFVVDRAIPKSEATKLQISQIAIANSQKLLTLVDTAGKSDFIDTKFKIKYQSKDPQVRFNRFNQNRYDFKTIYEGDISSSLVKSDRRNFTIDISQIPIPSEYLQSKVITKIELIATRSLGDTSIEQTLSWEGEVSEKSIRKKQ